MKITSTEVSAGNGDGTYVQFTRAVQEPGQRTPVLWPSCTCAEFERTRPENEPWCGHLRSFIDERRDIVAGFSEYVGDIRIVLSRSPGIAALVVIQNCSENENEVLLYIPQYGGRKAAKKNEPIRIVPIGYLRFGEGYGVVRDQLLDWFESLPMEAACTSEFHVGPTKVTSANRFDIAVSGVCRTCHESQVTFQDEDDGPRRAAVKAKMTKHGL